jgi:GTP-binding protein
MTSSASLPLAADAKPDPKIAMAWLHTAKFLTTAPELKHLPRIEVPEIAFVGRSNAGKSTCINTLTQQHRLAFASKTPGRTQSINLFSLGKQGVTDAVLADLPGYGYAAVPKEAKYRWQQVMGNYLQTRDNLQAIVLLCDPRLGLTELDEVLLDVIRPRVEDGLKFLVLLTKSDKLNKTDAAKALQIVKLQAGGGDVKPPSICGTGRIRKKSQSRRPGPRRNRKQAWSQTLKRRHRQRLTRPDLAQGRASPVSEKNQV